MKENKIKGTVIIYDPDIKNIKKIELEGDIQINWDEDFDGNIFYTYPWISSICPYDGEKIGFDIMLVYDDPPLETVPAGDCIHFCPSKFISDEEYDEMCEEIHTVESGLMYVNMDIEEFAEKMGWEIKWVGNPGNLYPIFVEKAWE